MRSCASSRHRVVLFACFAVLGGCSQDRADAVVLGVTAAPDVNSGDLAPSDLPDPGADLAGGKTDLDESLIDLGRSAEVSADASEVVLLDAVDVASPELVDSGDAGSVDAEVAPETAGDNLELPSPLPDSIDAAQADVDADAPGEVVTPICLAADATCVDGVPATCGAGGLAWVSLPGCATTETCKSGKCLPMLCQPNANGCTGNLVTTCSADGLAYLPGSADCAAAGLACVAGKCAQPPCGNGKIDPAEACDDGNTASGDGCSSGCQNEWKTILDEDFSPPPSNWTACAGCSGGGCPNAKTGALVCGGDWTRVCLPLADVSKQYSRVRMDFVVHGEVPLGAFWLAAGPVDVWEKQSPRIRFDAAGQGVTLEGEGAKPIGLLNFLPELPFTVGLRVEIDLLSGGVWVAKNGEPLQSLGSVAKVQSAPWVWNVATNYACCNGSLVGTWLDDFKASGVPANLK